MTLLKAHYDGFTKALADPSGSFPSALLLTYWDQWEGFSHSKCLLISENNTS